MMPVRRKPQATLGLSVIPWEAVAIAVAVIALSIGLWFLSRPSDAATRLEALETKAKLIASAQTAKGDLRTYPVGTVCTGDQINGFKGQVSSALMNAGLKTDVLDVSAAEALDGTESLEAYTLRFTGTGSYEAAMMALDGLNRQKPRLFVEALAIRNRVSAVDVEFEGRIYCRTPGTGGANG